MAEQERELTASDGEESDASTATAMLTKPAAPKRTPKLLPPYKVLLHNDDVNSFEHVIASILRLTTIPPEEAVLKTIEAHETDVALLLVTH